jgi:hypothetical protein
MTMLRIRRMFAPVLFAVCAALPIVGALPAAAQPAAVDASSVALQTERTLTLTEEQINDAYTITNPRGRRISNASVDLQPGQVVVSYDFTVRGRRGQPDNVYAVQSTLVPSVSDGRIYWTVTSSATNGEPVSDELLAQINAAFSSSWRVFLREQAPAGRVTGITITDTELVITYTVGTSTSGG